MGTAEDVNDAKRFDEIEDGESEWPTLEFGGEVTLISFASFYKFSKAIDKKVTKVWNIFQLK